MVIVARNIVIYRYYIIVDYIVLILKGVHLIKV